MKRDPLITGQVYHIVSRSISNFKIFNSQKKYERGLNLIQYFQIANPPEKFSNLLRLNEVKKSGFQKYFDSTLKGQKKRVKIIAYCLMPTHVHLLLKQLEDHGISNYISNFLNSFSRYFNIRHKRKGPLWESRFKSILVDDDSYLLHLTRYIHLNPATARLVSKPEKWQFSSYREYLGDNSINLANYRGLVEVVPKSYKKFVNDRIDYQRKLTQIKNLILDQTI